MFFSITSIALAQAQAQQTVAATGARPSFLEQIVPFVFLFVVFYFLIIRPQAKRQKTHQKFLENLKRGDSVLTSSGILGTIEGITEKFVTLEISEGVRIRLVRSHIASSPNEEANK